MDQQELSIEDRKFAIELLSSLAFAHNDVEEIMFYEYLFGLYGEDEIWWTSLVGESDEICGTTLRFTINHAVTFIVEFYPSETVYFFNDIFLGLSGGNAELSLLSWDEFLAITQNRNEELTLFFLLLPLVVGTKKQEEDISQYITQKLLQLPLDPQYTEQTISYILSHLIFPTDEPTPFIETPSGLICTRNHSQRNRSQGEEGIEMVQSVIRLAMHE